MAEIGRSLDEIDNKVAKLNKTLRESSSETKELDKALKLDSKNLDAVDKKMNLLQKNVGVATQKIALLKQKQLEANKALQDGSIGASEYKKIETAVLKAENELKKLNNEIEKTSKIKLNNITQGFDNLSNKLNKAKSVATSFSHVAMGLIASLTAVATAFVIVGDELDDTSKKFGVNVEELQLQRNLYNKVADGADGYDKALASLNQIMSSISRGQGTAYLEILQKLGVTTTDVNGKTKSTAEVYNELVAALSKVQDATERASLASIIFGDNGLNVANVAGLTKEQIEEYNEQLEESGIVSSDSAAKAGDVADKIYNLKQQLASASAEIMIALLPTIQAITEILQTTVIPIINAIAKWFSSMSPSQQKLVVFLLTMVIILPKVIAIITAIIGVVKAITIASYGAAGGIGAVGVASIPLIPILLAVVAVVLTLALLFAFLTGKSKDLTNSLDKQGDMLDGLTDKYTNLGNDTNLTATQTSENTNTSNNNINVNINATGDSSISEENANKVADALADKINKQLGGKI